MVSVVIPMWVINIFLLLTGFNLILEFVGIFLKRKLIQLEKESTEAFRALELTLLKNTGKTFEEIFPNRKRYEAHGDRN